MKRFFALIFLLISVNAIAEMVDTFEFHNQADRTRAVELAKSLRCPQCQNNNIADSNATIATDMRAKTLELLKQGKNKDEVVEYMVERYGNFVTYDPPLTPATIFLWILPILLILSGISLILMRKKKGSQAVEKSQDLAKSAQDKARLAKILNDKE